MASIDQILESLREAPLPSPSGTGRKEQVFALMGILARVDTDLLPVLDDHRLIRDWGTGLALVLVLLVCGLGARQGASRSGSGRETSRDRHECALGAQPQRREVETPILHPASRTARSAQLWKELLLPS